jgi:hypothetical protein
MSFFFFGFWFKKNSLFAQKQKGKWFSNPGNVQLQATKSGIGKYMPSTTTSTTSTTTTSASSTTPTSSGVGKYMPKTSASTSQSTNVTGSKRPRE